MVVTEDVPDNALTRPSAAGRSPSLEEINHVYCTGHRLTFDKVHQGAVIIKPKESQKNVLHRSERH